MSNSTKKAAEQAEREKVKRRYANRREPTSSIRPRSRWIFTMMLSISVLRSMSVYQQTILGRKPHMSSRKITMKNLFLSIPIGLL